MAKVAEDLVRHFEDRVAALDGKAMVVCMSRRICVALYQAITALRPDWHADDDQAGRLKVVMTGSAADPLEWQPHIGNKARRDLLTKRAKDPKDPLQLVIVRDIRMPCWPCPRRSPWRRPAMRRAPSATRSVSSRPSAPP